MELTAAGLASRLRGTSGYVPAWLADELLARGREEEVRRLARVGEWHCAERLARWLAGRGRVAAGLDELRPFVVTGWPLAVCSAALLLDGAARPVEALDLLRQHAGAGAGVQVLALAARLLVSVGRVDEAIELLGPKVAQPNLASALVDMTAGRGRDEQVEALMRDQVERSQAASSPDALPASSAVVLLATVLDRQGRADEAISLLAGHIDAGPGVTRNEIDQLAWLLQRVGAEESLRELAAGRGGSRAALALVRLLVQADRDQEAEMLLRSLADEGRSAREARPYAEFLVERGRVDEALDMLRRRLMEKEDLDGVARWIAGVLVGEGRVAEAIELYDDMERSHETRFETFRERVSVLLSGGRVEMAVEEASAYAERDPTDGPEFLAEVLCEAGRFDEGLAVIEGIGRSSVDSALVASLLIGKGDYAQALAVFT